MRRSLPILALVLTSTHVAAAELELFAPESIFAVITHKGGFAAGMAHNHLIAAAGYRARLSFDPQAPLATRFELEQAADQLALDPWDLEQEWYPRLAELGILDQDFSEVAAGDRAKIRKSMLGPGQLDADRFPAIKARITEVREEAAGTFPYAATLELEIRGKQVSKPVAARYELAGGVLTIEATGSFRFTDFGIKPYSAFLGAVKNEDLFHVYVNLRSDQP